MVGTHIIDIGITARVITTVVIDIIAHVITMAAIDTTARGITTVGIGTMDTGTIGLGISGTATTVYAGTTMVAIATGLAGDRRRGHWSAVLKRFGLYALAQLADKVGAAKRRN